MFAVYQVDWTEYWTEYESGWGCRPDGTTYYKDKATMDKHVKEYSDMYLNDKVTPACYTMPHDGRLVEVGAELYTIVNNDPKGYIWD